MIKKSEPLEVCSFSIGWLYAKLRKSNKSPTATILKEIKSYPQFDFLSFPHYTRTNSIEI